jgi:tetratricopeptide (TPR) repeat protein
MQRLVQAAARTPEPGDPHRDRQAIDTARKQATAQLAATIPDDDPAQWPTCRTLLPHISALASHTFSLTVTETTASIFHQAGIFLLGLGQVTQAAEYLQRTFTSLGRVLSSDHSGTLAACNSLAAAYLKAGNLGRAIPLFEQSCADLTRVLGGDHPSTLASRNNLGRALLAAGNLGQAIPMLEQSLADRQRVLGIDDPYTLTARNNLARAYQDAKDLLGKLLEQVAEGRQPETDVTVAELLRQYMTVAELDRSTRQQIGQTSAGRELPSTGRRLASPGRRFAGDRSWDRCTAGRPLSASGIYPISDG